MGAPTHPTHPSIRNSNFSVQKYLLPMATDMAHVGISSIGAHIHQGHIFTMGTHSLGTHIHQGHIFNRGTHSIGSADRGAVLLS